MKYETSFWSTGIALNNELTITIEDSIRGRIEIEFPESRLLTTSLMIRINNIKQLGSTSYINSGATHTRLSHQLGAYHLSKEIWKAILQSDEFKNKVIDVLKKRIKEHWLGLKSTGFTDDSDVDKTVNSYQKQIIEFLEKIGSKIVGAAVLLHDIGHGGWGHILDPLNGFIAHRIAVLPKSLKTPLEYRIDRVMAEPGKLDITTAIYIILNNEQIIKALTEGFANYIEGISGDNDFYEVFRDMVKKLNIIPAIIDMIIFEDMGIPVKNGPLWIYLLMWYSGLFQEEARNREARNQEKRSKIFAIIAELLAIIVMLGIQILGDIKTEGRKIAGFNVDRLDWIPRDSFHLGLCNGLCKSAKDQSDDKSDIICRRLEKICNMIDILRDPEQAKQNLEFEVDDENWLLYVYPSNDLTELHKTVREVRKFMYEKYYHNKKGIYDSILVRAGYAAVSIIWDSLVYNVNHLLAIRTVIAHILNNDELFISNTSELLLAVRSLRDLYISAMSSLLPVQEIKGDNYYEWIKEFSERCDDRCKHIINNLYVLFSADEEMLHLMNQPYTLIHLKNYDESRRIYQPIHIETPGNYPDKIVIIKEIKLKDVEPLSLPITLIKKIKENKKSKDLQKLERIQKGLQKEINEVFSYFSNHLERVEIPLLEYMLNEVLRRLCARFDHIYVNYIHYGLRDYADILKSSSPELDDESIESVMDKPLLYIFFSYSVDKKKKGEIKKEEDTYIDKVRDIDNCVRGAINAWMTYVIIKNMSSSLSKRLVEEILVKRRPVEEVLKEVLKRHLDAPKTKEAG